MAACQQDTRVCGSNNRWEFADSSAVKKIVNVPCITADDNTCTPLGTGLTAYNKCSFIISVENPDGTSVTDAPGFSISTSGANPALTSVDLFYVEMSDLLPTDYLTAGGSYPSYFPDPA